MAIAVGTAIRNPVVVYVGKTRPSLYDTITRSTNGGGGGGIDLSGAEARFSMRGIFSRIPLLDQVEAKGFKPDENGFNIVHDWTTPEVEEEGEYMGWWTFTLQGEERPQETPEFPIIITDHGPGQGVATGAIVENVAGEMPTTFDSLRKDIRFGDRFMQAKAELIKWRVLGYTTTPDEEQNLHPVLLAYFSKRVALELVPPGIDYWSRQHRTVTTTGTSEVASYPDMIKSLETLKVTLFTACKELWQELQFIVPSLPKRNTLHLPTSNIADTFAATCPVTMDPDFTQRLQTARFGWDLTLGVFPFP